MLNTGLHVAAKKLGNKAKGASMSLEEYIANTRCQQKRLPWQFEIGCCTLYIFVYQKGEPLETKTFLDDMSVTKCSFFVSGVAGRWVVHDVLTAS